MFKRIVIILVIIGLSFGFKSQAYSTFSNGTLIKGSGPEVYVIEYGLKRWIPTPLVFKNLFYNWDKIIKVTDSLLNSFPIGNKMSSVFSEGALLRSDKGPKVYLNDNNKLRWIPDPYIFNSNNFSWENIIVIPDSKLNAIKKGTDVKYGEFINLPTTFLIAKPPEESDVKKVVFSYSGTNPTGPVSELMWETYLEGYDTVWQRASSTYTRTVDLPAVNKEYTFYVRSRNKDGKIDAYPVSYKFRIIDYSSLYSQLKIASVTRKAVPALNESIKITNNSKERVDITGLMIKNRRNETINIPQAAEFLNLQFGELLKNLVLDPGKSVIVFSGHSPVGKNFRLNKCTGYLNNYYSFSPKLPNECPKPIDQDLVGLSLNCRNYIKSLGVCASPKTSDVRVMYDSQCTNYLLNTFNYSNCLAVYRAYPDFLRNDWYVYLNRSNDFWDDLHDEAKLLDKSGNLISSYTY